MLSRVALSRDVFWACMNHALTTEHEEIMGLILGSVDASGTATVTRSLVLTRKVKLKDRVEVGYEDLAGASAIAEMYSEMDQVYCRVLGWYHSHPHITVFPSHVDVRTQGQYQQLDSYFVGLIFSVFDKGGSGVCAFQASFENGDWKRIEIPISIIERALPRQPRRLDGLLQLQYELMQEYCGLSNAPATSLTSSFMEQQRLLSSRKLAISEVLETQSLPLLSALRSKRLSLQREKEYLIRSSVSGDNVKPVMISQSNMKRDLSAPQGIGSMLLWKNYTDALRIVSNGITARAVFSSGRVIENCHVRIVIDPCVSCASCMPDAAQAENQVMGQFRPRWICRLGIENVLLVTLDFIDLQDKKIVQEGQNVDGEIILKLRGGDVGAVDFLVTLFMNSDDPQYVQLSKYLRSAINFFS
jgi:proteasome lid subunit RPN8/RPN11